MSTETCFSVWVTNLPVSASSKYQNKKKKDRGIFGERMKLRTTLSSWKALYCCVFFLTVLPLVLVAGAVDSSVSYTEVETMQEVNEIRRTQGPVQFWLTYLATPEEMALLRAAESVQLELDELSRRVADESKLHRTALVEAKQLAIAKRNAILSTVTVPAVRRGTTRGGSRRSDDGDSTNAVEQRVPFWGALLSRAPNAARYLMTEELQSELATEHLQFVVEKWIQQTIRNESSVVMDPPKFCLLQPFDEEHAVLHTLAKVECSTGVNSTTASLQWKDAPGVPFLFTTKEWSLRVASISDHRLYHLEELEMSVSAERDDDFSEGTRSLEGAGEGEVEVDARTEEDEEAVPFAPSAASPPTVTNLRLSDELRRTGPSGDVYEQLQRQARQQLLRQLDDRLAEVLAGVDSTKLKSHVLSERAKLHEAQVELSLVDGSFFGMFTTERIGCKMDTINEPLAAAARGFVQRARERRQRATSFFLQDLCGLLSEIPTEFYDQLKAAEEVELQSDDDHQAEL